MKLIPGRLPRVVMSLVVTVCALAIASCGMQTMHDKVLPILQANKVSEKQLVTYSSASLQAAADSLYETHSGKHRACLIYKILTTRYLKNPNDAATSIHANMKLWERYLFDYHDVNEAMEYLNDAADISETQGIETSDIPYAYATSYQTMGNHTREAELFKKALDYYDDAVSKMTKETDIKIYDRLVSNYLTLLYSLGRPMKRAQPLLDKYSGIACDASSDSLRLFNIELSKGLTDLQGKRYTQAAYHFRQMRTHVGPKQRKQVALSILNEATALRHAGQILDAIKILDSADSTVVNPEDLEVRVSLYFTKYKYWEMLGDTENTHRFYIQYCQVRDSLLSYNQITGLQKAEFSQSITRMGHKIVDLEYRGKVQTVVIIASTIILILLIAFILVIRNKNRVLRESNKSLYEQNQAVLAAEKREREERHRYADLVEALKHDLEDMSRPVEKPEKYLSRKLTDISKNEIHDMIMNVMENCPEIYKSDFSLARLSELCGSRQEYVSQVINETFNCNFNELINRYRIREACRRIDDKQNYGQFTLAAIAQGVGIDSATTFSKYFKKTTGLTPSLYKKNSDSIK